MAPSLELQYLASVVIPIHVEHIRARSTATNTFIVVEGAAFALGGALLPLPLAFSFLDLALPLFAILAAVCLILWDSRNRAMLAACLQVGAEIEGRVTALATEPLLRRNLRTLAESRLLSLRGLASHTWAIRLLAAGSIAFWTVYLLQAW